LHGVDVGLFAIVDWFLPLHFLPHTELTHGDFPHVSICAALRFSDVDFSKVFVQFCRLIGLVCGLFCRLCLTCGLLNFLFGQIMFFYFWEHGQIML
jgi:hypothetical protein